VSGPCGDVLGGKKPPCIIIKKQHTFSSSGKPEVLDYDEFKDSVLFFRQWFRQGSTTGSGNMATKPEILIYLELR